MSLALVKQKYIDKIMSRYNFLMLITFSILFNSILDIYYVFDFFFFCIINLIYSVHSKSNMINFYHFRIENLKKKLVFNL